MGDLACGERRLGDVAPLPAQRVGRDAGGGVCGGVDKGLWGSMGGGRVSDGQEGGGGFPTTAQTPPPNPRRNPTPPTPLK